MVDLTSQSQDTAHIIDGKEIAAQRAVELKRRIQKSLEKARQQGRDSFAPGLGIIRVGEDPASGIYVKRKVELADFIGIHAEVHALPEKASETAVMDVIGRLNAQAHIHGIILQLPLPKGLSASRLIGALDPRKDVDGLHPLNQGFLMQGAEVAYEMGFMPCTPLGCMELMQAAGVDQAGAMAVVVGRSNLMGKPMAQLLLSKDATVVQAHSRTQNLPDLIRQADIVVAAVGRPHLIQGDWIKPGACIIDVGISRTERPDGTHKLLGDVDFEVARKRASAITPVPGGVGPMTVQMLMENTYLSFRRWQKMHLSNSRI